MITIEALSLYTLIRGGWSYPTAPSFWRSFLILTSSNGIWNCLPAYAASEYNILLSFLQHLPELQLNPQHPMYAVYPVSYIVPSAELLTIALRFWRIGRCHPCADSGWFLVRLSGSFKDTKICAKWCGTTCLERGHCAVFQNRMREMMEQRADNWNPGNPTKRVPA